MHITRYMVASIILIGGTSGHSVWAQEAASGPAGSVDTALDATAPPTASPNAGVAPSEGTAKKAPGSPILEEIVVTAQKREENLRDVPISVAAFSGDKLEALGIDNPASLPQITPGLQYDNLVGYNIIYMRGVGSDIFLPSADSSVATYIDGIYTPFAHSLAQDFGKIKRIEVLKGPQGTLFGRNTTGGAINTISAEPQRTFGGSGSYETGNFNERKLKIYVTGPVSDVVQFGLSAFVSSMDSYYERPAGSRYPDFAQDRTHGVQLRINWDIAESLATTLTAMMTRQTGSTQQILSSLQVRPTFTLLVPEEHQPWVANPDSQPYGRSENDMIYGEVRWKSPFDFDAKLLGSHQNIVTDFNVDFDGDSSPLVNFNPKNQGAIYNTAELQFLSNPESWMSDRLKWIVGFYFYQQRKAGFRDIELGVGGGLTQPTVGVALNAINDLIQQLGLPAVLPNGVDVYFNGLLDADSQAAFAQGTYNVTDWFDVTLGGRYQTETKKLTQSELGYVADGQGGPLSPPLLSYAPRSKDSKNFSPKVTLDFKPVEGTLIFLSAQRGFKSGTYQIANIASTPEYIKPEVATTYELGLKGDFFEDTFQYSMGIFQNDIKNVQVANIALQNGGAISFENAGEAQIRGVDGDLTWQPLPEFLPGLVLTASGAYLDGKYLSYPNATGFDSLGILQHNFDYKGHRTVRTPKYSYNVGGNYQYDLGSGLAEAGVSYYYNDGYWFDAQNVAEQPSYTLLNAHASYLYKPWSVKLSVYGMNLGNSAYFLSRFPVDFNISGLYAAPRTFGARLDYSF